MFDCVESFYFIDHLLHEFDLGVADALVVGDVQLTARAFRSVFSVTASSLDAEALREVFELVRSECV